MLKQLQKKKELDRVETSSFLKIPKGANAMLTVLFVFLCILCIVPMLFVLIISLSSEKSINTIGFSFVPIEWSLDAYKHIFSSGSLILSAFNTSVIVTLSGVFIGLMLCVTYAYVLSRKEYRYNKFLTYVMLITMLFHGGMVANYMLVTQMLNLKNTIWALILPTAVSAFNITILRTFIKTSVPNEIVESARIDGASEFGVFFRMVLPISVPGIATIGLFLSLGYWNQWMPSLMYTDKKSLYTLQFLLMQIEKNIQYLSQSETISSMDALLNLPTESARMAIVIVATLPIACAYPFFQRYFISGLTVGAVKG